MKGGKQMNNNFTSYQRGAVLVDSSNVYITSLNLGVRVDYRKILGRLNGRRIVRSIFYHVERDRGREAPFIQRIVEMGFEIKAKQRKTYSDGTTKGYGDVDIAVDAIALSEKIDAITLISGDGDFASLVYYLKSRGIKTEVMAFEHNTSSDLRKAVDQFYAITPDMYLDPEGPRVS
jgi:uncharacterized LabA/DUF88 family protein